MDESRYHVREFRDTDYDALAAIANAVDPDEPVSAQSIRHMVESMRQSSDPHFFVVADRGSGEVVGTGVVFRPTFSREPTTQWIVENVLPDRQREGIGSALYDLLRAEAERRGAVHLRCAVLETSASGRSFVAKRKFVESRRTWRSRLDVSSADTTSLASLIQTARTEGIEYTTLAREGRNDLEVLHRVHELFNEASKDVPQDGEPADMSFQAFREFFLEGENALPDAWFLAKQGDRYVSVSSAAREPAQPQVLQQYFTGTRREARGKKLAVALKLMVIEFAKRNGYVHIETSNDSLNAPMWEINRRLGFRKVRETVQLDCSLVRPPGDPPPTGN
jgi:GNAT superfamily N-acetyltransferase